MRRADANEFEQVFRSAYPSVLRVVLVILRDRGRAEEVTQDAFLRLYERWPRAASYDHPAAWVRTVAVRDAVRRAARERRQPVSAIAADGASSDRWPDLDVLDAVAALPPRQRAAVALFYLEDRPVDEIAHLMEVSVSTVKQHLFQARGRLGVVLLEGADDVH